MCRWSQNLVRPRGLPLPIDRVITGSRVDWMEQTHNAPTWVPEFMGLIGPLLPPWRAIRREVQGSSNFWNNSTARLLCVERALRSPGRSGFGGQGHQWFLQPSDALDLTLALERERARQAHRAVAEEAASSARKLNKKGSKTADLVDAAIKADAMLAEVQAVAAGAPSATADGEVQRRVRVTLLQRRKIRVVDNFDALIRELAQAPGAALREVKVVEFEGKGFHEQASIAWNSDVFIAPHGAGLVNIMWQQPCAAVVELFTPEYILPGYFGNLAAQSGHLYFPWCAGDAHTGGQGVPCVSSLEVLAGWHRQCKNFNISVPEVSRSILAAVEAQQVCRRARASWRQR